MIIFDQYQNESITICHGRSRNDRSVSIIQDHSGSVRNSQYQSGWPRIHYDQSCSINIRNVSIAINHDLSRSFRIIRYQSESIRNSFDRDQWESIIMSQDRTRSIKITILTRIIGKVFFKIWKNNIFW